MAASVCEITRFPSSATYRADPSILHRAYDLLHGTSGVQATYYGLQATDESHLYGFTLWDSVEHHMVFVSDKPAYRRLLSELAPSIGGPATLVLHVPFLPDPRTQLKAPCVNLACATLQKDCTNADISYMRERLSRLRNCAWGQTLEDPRTFVVMTGSYPELEQQEFFGLLGQGDPKLDFVELRVVQIAVVEYSPSVRSSL